MSTGVADRLSPAGEDGGGPAGSHRGSRALYGGVWWVAAALVALEMAVSARYGFHRDELYFIACGHHLAFGYVDQPPLAPALTRLATALFGTSPTAVRVFPALAGGAVVVGTGLTAAALGGNRFAQLLSATAMACAPVTLGSAHLAGTTVYDLATWTFALWLVIRAVVLDRPRSWLGAGAVVGIGLENKDLALLLVRSLALGLLVTRARSVLMTPWPWLGLSIAVVLWMPNALWQLTHGIPALTMSRSLAASHSAPSDYVGFLPAQLGLSGFFAAPLLVVGLLSLARRRDLRFVALAAAVTWFYVFVTIPGRQYYTAGFLPLVFASGSVRVAGRDPRRIRRTLWLAAPVVGLALTAAFILPVLPLSAFARIPSMHKIDYDAGETVGWPQLTATIAEAYDALPPVEQKSASIFTSNYGEAGAVALYGPSLGLPYPLSGHNTFWLWGPGQARDQAVVAVGSVTQLRAHFGRCDYDATFHSPDNVDNDENNTQIWTCSDPFAPWSAFWGDLRHYN